MANQYNFEREDGSIHPDITIHDRSDGADYWRIVYYTHDRRRREKSGGLTQETAFAKAGEVAAMLDNGPGAPKGKRSIDQMGQWWLDEARHNGWAGRTRDNYQQLWKHLPPSFTALACDTVKRDDIKGVLDDARYTDDKADRIRKMLKKAFNDAFADGWFSGNPDLLFKGVTRGGKKRTTTRKGDHLKEVTAEDVPSTDLLIAVRDAPALHTLPYGPLLIELLAAAGPRIGEALAVRPKDLTWNDNGGVAKIHRQVVTYGDTHDFGLPKGGIIRNTYIPPVTSTGYELANELKTWADHITAQSGEDAPLFATPTGKYFRQTNLTRKVWNEARTQAGWPESDHPEKGGFEWSYHALRHYAARWWIYEMGMDIADASNLLGHADTSITMKVYAGPRGGSLTDRVGALFA